MVKLPQHSYHVAVFYFMKQDFWSKFLLPCSVIDDVFTKPKGVNSLNKNDEKKLAKLSLLEEKTDQDLAEIEKIKAKELLFNNPPLSKTAISMLTGKYAWFKYEKKMASKGGFLSYLDKGNVLENDAINIMSDIDKVNYVKNSLKLKNEFLIGCPDIISKENNLVIDTKVAWNLNTFLMARNGLEDKYWFQAQGYMELCDIDICDVCFLLLDTPYEIVQREFSKIISAFTLGEISIESYNEKIENLSSSMAYNNIPLKRRIIRYRVKRDKSVMPIIYKKVEMCRDFLRRLDKEHMRNKIIVSLHPKKVNVNQEEDNS